MSATRCRRRPGPYYLVRSSAWLVGVACVLATGGCRRAATSSAAGQGAAPATPIVSKTPQDATRSLLVALRAQLQATGSGDRAAARRYRDEVVKYIVARDQLTARYRALPTHAPQGETEMLGALVENWASILSYYADGLALDEMKLGVTGSEGSGAVVDVPARGPEDRAIVRVACVRQADDEWRVLAIGLEPATAPALSTQPAAASQPTTASG